MSKSLGNVILPQTIAEKNGADILRLWAASSDFTEDLRIGQDIIKANVDAYRRLRNTIRFMLANLSGFDEKERIGHDEMPELERYMLARLAELDAHRARGLRALRLQPRLHHAVQSSAPTSCRPSISTSARTCSIATRRQSTRRRAARTVIDEIFRRVVTWFAPILCFTMEEAWTAALPGRTTACICKLSSRYAGRLGESGAGREVEAHPRAAPRRHRRAGTGARRDKVIGASLEAAPLVYVADDADRKILDSIAARRDRDHLRPRISPRSTRRTTRSAFPMSRASAAVRARPRRQMRALLDDPGGSG